METIEFRKAHEKDIDDILKVVKKSFIEYAKAIIKEDKVEALKETREDILKDLKKKHVYICKVDGDTVGTVRFEILPEGIAYLSRLAVDPDIQNLGIGGLLLEKVRRECIDMDLNAILLFTASKMRSSVAFYLKNGYYIHNITKNRSYIRALLVNELKPMDEMFDYEAIVADK